MPRIGFIPVLLLLACLAGCRQHRFATDADLQKFRVKALDVPPATIEPADLPAAKEFGPVTTVNSPEAPKRYICLTECVALALENGRTAERLDQVAGALIGEQASASNLTDSIRVFAYDPAILATEIEESLAKFDARWQTSMVWNKIDRPVGTPLDTFQAGAVDAIQEDTAQFRTELLKPLPTGGLAGITYRTDYEFTNLDARVNPAYRPALEFTFEQPLLQGAGVFINQLRTSHPGGIRTGLTAGGRVPGIILARISHAQSQADFERRVQDLLFAVERAYWELYCAYWEYYSREMAMRQALEGWQVAKVRHQNGIIPIQDLAQIEQQYQAFRAQRLQALGRGTGRPGVLEAERRLRYVIGLASDDGTRLIPSDVPIVAPFQPDWNIALSEAMALRPELLAARQAIQAASLAVLREKDLLLPDVRFFASYDINAIGSRLDGRGEDNALRNLAENRFNNWTMGIRMDLPIGKREAYSEVQRAELLLAQRAAFLQDQESKVAFTLKRSYRDLIQFSEEMRIQQARRLAAATQLKARHIEFMAGRGTIDFLLESQRNWADALRDEHFSICDYNIALIDFERQKGTIMQHDNVTIAEGPLPVSALAHASEHIRERARSLILKDTTQPKNPQATGADGIDPQVMATILTSVLPAIQAEEAVPIPTVMENQKRWPAAPERLEPALGRNQ